MRLGTMRVMLYASFTPHLGFPFVSHDVHWPRAADIRKRSFPPNSAPGRLNPSNPWPPNRATVNRPTHGPPNCATVTGTMAMGKSDMKDNAVAVVDGSEVSSPISDAVVDLVRCLQASLVLSGFTAVMLVELIGAASPRVSRRGSVVGVRHRALLSHYC